MICLRRLVVAVLLAVWSVPAAGLARGESRGSQGQSGSAGLVDTKDRSRGGVAGTAGEARQYAEREKQSRNLEQFTGGHGGVYIGGGLVTVLLIVIIILLII